MAKLVVNIGVLPPNLDHDSLRVACSAEEAVRFASFVDKEVLVSGALFSGQSPLIVATARLDEFSPAKDGSSVTLSNLHLLPSEIPFPSDRKAAVMSLMEEADFTFLQTDLGVLRTNLKEAYSPFLALDIYAEIAGQVRRKNQSICGFSGVLVTLGEGSAMPIVPRDSGGSVHARNFIFLHDEPAHLFNQFAWTIGPDLEIIVDCRAMGTNVLSTINPGGKLVVGTNHSDWPDERALAWHRKRFFDRLR